MSKSVSGFKETFDKGITQGEGKLRMEPESLIRGAMGIETGEMSRSCDDCGTTVQKTWAGN